MATPDELAVIYAVKHSLRQSPPPPNLPEDGKVVAVQLLRVVREHGTDARAVERVYRRALAWKRDNLPDKPELDALAESRWLCAAEMPHGEWAVGHWPIGFHCGYSKSGSPVKLERLGACAPPSDTKLLYPYYLALVDTLQRRLDRTSVTSGRLQQTYELFDLAGLGTCSLVDFTTPPCPRHVLDTPCACPAGTHMVTFTTLSFTKDVMLAFATHYPSSFSKAVVINAPSFMARLYRILSTVLPASVKAKVSILGAEYEAELANDLTPETLYWVTTASHAQLCRAPFRDGAALAQPAGSSRAVR